MTGQHDPWQQPAPGQWPGYPMPGGHQQPPPRRRWLIWLAATIVVITAAVVVPVVLLNHDSGGTPTVHADARRTSSSPTAAKPKPQAKDHVYLNMTAGSGQPLRWGATPMYDACALLPMSAVTNAGIALDPAYPTSASRPDPVKPGGVGFMQPNAGLGSSNCGYSGMKQQNNVDLDIYQAPFSKPEDIQLQIQLAQVDPKTTVSGFDIYTRVSTRPADWTVTITNQQVVAELVLTDPVDPINGDIHGAVASLTDKVLAGLRQPPGPPARFTYSAPYAGLDPCGLFTAQDFQDHVGGPDDGHPEAIFQLGEREFDPDHGYGPVGYYVTTTCQRFTVAADQGDPKAIGIVVDFNTYRTVDQARAFITNWCDPKATQVYGPPVPVKIKVGDDVACYPTLNGKDWQLTFRAGRTVASVWVWLTIDRSQLDTFTPATAQLANALAAKLESW
jgi:hypothetical protein